MVTHEDFTRATERANELRSRMPRAVSARYDRHTRCVVVQLSSNLGIFFSPRDAEGLEHATVEELQDVEITPSGYGLHFPQLDADLYVPALLEGMFGSERWMAQRAAQPGIRNTRRAKPLKAMASQ